MKESTTDDTDQGFKGIRISNSPDKGPLELLRLAWDHYVDTDTDQ